MTRKQLRINADLIEPAGHALKARGLVHLAASDAQIVEAALRLVADRQAPPTRLRSRTEENRSLRDSHGGSDPKR